MATDAERAGASDEALVAEFQRDPDGVSGRAALESLIQRWSGRVYRWAYRFVREHEQALDLSQDCMVRAIQALPRYEARGRFSAWLFTIVHNRCRSEVRRRSWSLDPEIDTERLVANEPGPEAEFASAEAQGRLFAAMETALDMRERVALWLRAVEGMSVEDITCLLRVEGASGARGLLQTARRKLKAALDPGMRREEKLP
jgi:RNA polymerase sigma-70 factor (ECF subfamily)